MVQWLHPSLQVIQGSHQLRARMGIPSSAIAQNFVENSAYFPLEVQANPRFQDRLWRDMPRGRLVSADEDAPLAACLGGRRWARRVYQASGLTW